MAWGKLVILLAFISVCSAATIFDDELIRRSYGGECDSSVIETMADYGVDTSSLRCFSDSQERGFHKKRGLQLFRRSCCGVSCAWMASELGVEPSTLICPT